MKLHAMSLIAAVTLLGGCSSQQPAPPGTVAPAATGVVEGSVQSADGVQIRYRAEGSGDTALVFVHCWSCDGGYWKNQVPYFSSSYRVVTLDLAGHGTSGAGRRSWTIDAYAADVKAVVEKLDLEKVVLIGHSMSGPIIVEAALKLPDRVVALIPVDTLHDLSEKPDPRGMDGILKSLRTDFRKGATDLVRQLFPATADPALVDEVARDIASAPPEVAIATFESLARYDIRPALERLRVPIRCINGDKWPTRIEESRKVYPRFDAVILPGVGHFPMLEAPKQFNEKLLQAVRELAG
jgi:pimeloyl-ACP methyl ester carboxylesterase